MARWVAGAAVAVVAVVGATVVVRVTSGPSESATAVAATSPAATLVPSGAAVSARPASTTAQAGGGAQAAPPEPTSGWIATVTTATRWSTTLGGAAVGSLATKNPYGGPETLAVVGAPSLGGWLHVELPVRPNATTGWIPASAAHLTWTDYSIQVSLAAKTLTLFDGTKAVLESSVAVGTPSTPTPPDHTYVWELVQPPDPTGDYGPYIFGLAEFSDAYAIFNGGDAQIAIHGTDEPDSIGQASSNGCVRLPDSVVTQLVGVLPLGTPVTISE